jgi:hypothetical protein
VDAYEEPHHNVEEPTARTFVVAEKHVDLPNAMLSVSDIPLQPMQV